ISADRYTNKARTTSFALCFPDGIQHAGSDSFQVPVDTLALNLRWQAVLRAHVFASAALQDEAHMDVGVPCLFPMEHRAPRAEIVAGVCSVNTVDGVLAEVAFCRSFFDCVTAKMLQFELVDATRCFEIKTNRPCILANRQRTRFSQPDILRD